MAAYGDRAHPSNDIAQKETGRGISAAACPVF
jgi:hypothetical protein